MFYSSCVPVSVAWHGGPGHINVPANKHHNAAAMEHLRLHREGGEQPKPAPAVGTECTGLGPWSCFTAVAVCSDRAHTAAEQHQALGQNSLPALLPGCDRRGIVATNFPVKGIVVLLKQTIKTWQCPCWSS